MKKIASFILCFLLLFGFCSCLNTKTKEVTIHVQYSLGDHSTTLVCEKNSYISFSQIDLSEILSNKYYFIGWFTDSEYKKQVYGMKVTDETTIYGKLGLYKDADQYYFGKMVDKEQFRQHMELNGQESTLSSVLNTKLMIALKNQDVEAGDNYYYIKGGRNSTSVSMVQELMYFPKSDLILCAYTTTEQSSLATVVSTITYTGMLVFTLGQKVSEAKAYGFYDGSSDNVATYSSAGYSVCVTFTVPKVKSDSLELGDFESVQYSASITNASNYSKAQKAFNERREEIVGTCYGRVQSGVCNSLESFFSMVDSSYHLITE